VLERLGDLFSTLLVIQMPKGQSPSQRMDARYSLLSQQLEKTPKDYSTFTKIRRKVNEFLQGSDDVQYMTTQKRRSLMQKVKKMESTVGQKFRSQQNIEEEQARRGR
jgi:hypothetical protein